MTTTTSTAHRIARQRLTAPDCLLYFPVDFPVIMRRAFRIIRPAAVCLVECELWPNLIRCCAERSCPLALVNGRISPNSFAGYRLLRSCTRRLLPCFAWCGVQSESDRQRLVHLGAHPERTVVTGSVKYEVEPRDPAAEERVGAWLAVAGFGPETSMVLGGSTWAGEELVLARWYQQEQRKRSDLRLVLVPRHAERANEVQAELQRLGLQVARRSQWDVWPAGQQADVLLIDTTGELRHFYAHADLIFVGKSLTQHGGQNMIEPAAYGKPVIVGPNMENFALSMEEFKAVNAIVQVSSAMELERVLSEWIADPGRREALGARAAQHVARKAGAIQATLDQVWPLLD